MSCVQIILENGDLHPIKTDALFKKTISFKYFPGSFWKGPLVSEIAVTNHATISLEVKGEFKM
jgi:hypothetical protein